MFKFLHKAKHPDALLAPVRDFALLLATVTMFSAYVDGFVGDLSGLNLGLVLGLGFGAGLVISLPWVLGFTFFTILPTKFRFIPWFALSIGLGLYLASALNAFDRLSSPHRMLAVATIAASLVAALGAGFVSWVMQPPKSGRQGLPAWVWQRARWLMAGLLFFGGLSAVLAERHVLVGLYPVAHKATLLLGFFAMAGGLTFAFRGLLVRKLIARPLWLVGLALVVNAFMVLHRNADETIHAMRQRPTVAFAMDVLRDATDIDRDDFSGLLGGGDCGALNAQINPGVPEIPDNGIDDNCRLGDATRQTKKKAEPVATKLTGAVTTEQEVNQTSVVLITIDTVRADHWSVYGYARKTTPQMERYVTNAMVFDRAYSSSAWTSLAISSLMRGLYPRHMLWSPVYETNKFRLVEAHELDSLAADEKVKLTFTMPLNDPRKTLAERLQAAGFHTAALVNDGYAEFLSEKMGVGAGFDRFETMDDAPSKKRSVKHTVSRALKMLKAMPKDQNFFFWLHLFGPHDPSSRHRASPKFGTSVKDRYDHELHYTDLQLGRFLRRLRTMEKKQDIATVITSDHGELFFKKRRYHGVNLHESNIKVPIIISAPGWPAGRTETLASLVDITPTILALTGAPSAPGMDGDDLAPYVFGYKDARSRIRLAETWYLRKDGSPSRDMVAAFTGRYKVVHNRVKNLTKVVDQRDRRKRPRNLGRKFKRAKRALDVLERYIESTSGPIWAEQPQ